MKIAYGPPPATGVKSLQYVGDDADYRSMNLEQLAKPIGKVAAGVWIYGLVTGNKSLKLAALGVGLGALFIQATSKEK